MTLGKITSRTIFHDLEIRLGINDDRQLVLPLVFYFYTLLDFKYRPNFSIRIIVETNPINEFATPAPSSFSDPPSDWKFSGFNLSRIPFPLRLKNHRIRYKENFSFSLLTPILDHVNFR